jgi:hypothetical protein
MIKFVPCFIFTLFIISLAWGDDYYSQRIGLDVDTGSKYTNISTIIVKTVLSLAEDDSNIIIYPGDEPDLETLGIRNLNARILVRTDKKGVNFKISLFEEGTNKILLDDSVEFSSRDIVFSVKSAALKLLDTLEADFPRKKIEEVKQIEQVKETVSEFESAVPVWSISLTPGLSSLNTSLLLTSSNNGNNGNSSNFQNTGYSLQADALFRYREWNASLGAGLFLFGSEGQTISCHIGGGYGIFGSLIIVGIDAQLFLNHFVPPGGGVIFTSSNQNESVSWIEFTAGNILICPTLQFNITQSYYIILQAGLPLRLSSGTISFDSNSVKTVFNDSAGPPFVKFLFNIALSRDWRINIEYFWYSIRLNNNSMDQNYAAGPFYINSFSYNMTEIGVGIEYVF